MPTYGDCCYTERMALRLCDGQPCDLRIGQSADDAMCGVVGFALYP